MDNVDLYIEVDNNDEVKGPVIKRGSLEELERFTKMVSTDRVTFVNELESVLRMAIQFW